MLEALYFQYKRIRFFQLSLGISLKQKETLSWNQPEAERNSVLESARSRRNSVLESALASETSSLTITGI